MSRHKGSSLDEFTKDYVVIDIETTGFNPKKDKILEVAGIKVRDNEIIDTFQSFINAGVRVPSHITKLTGIKQNMVDTAPDACLVIRDFIEFINNDVIVGHNVNFDINFIYDACLELNHTFNNDFIDTMKMSRRLMKEMDNHKLTTLKDHFQIKNISHRALADCETTKCIYDKLKNNQ